MSATKVQAATRDEHYLIKHLSLPLLHCFFLFDEL